MNRRDFTQATAITLGALPTLAFTQEAGFWTLQREGGCVLPISQSELGSMLSLSRQTTNQILMDLQQRGVLRLAYGRIEVLDRSGLEAAARLTPAELRILQRWGTDEPQA